VRRGEATPNHWSALHTTPDCLEKQIADEESHKGPSRIQSASECVSAALETVGSISVTTTSQNTLLAHPLALAPALLSIRRCECAGHDPNRIATWRAALAKKMAKGAKKKAAKRTLIDSGTDKRFVRRTGGGTFKESDDVGRSLAVDGRKGAKTKVESGQGDKGDR